jgi:magnesium-transporting ATPase (P-type)
LPWWLHRWHCYKDPSNPLLTALAAVSYATADAKATIVIGMMVGLSTAIRFVQGHRSTRAAEALRAMVSNTATVLRQGRRDIPIRSLVPGDLMSDSALAQAAVAHQVFAKLAPLHRERIVCALRAQGHVVGFMGDGIDDAPALLSVDAGVDIAKEAADVILLEKSLMVIDEGVVEGRATFCNMLKYIRMTGSSNFGNVFSVLVASAFLPFLPMLPMHLLVQNLLYDVSQTGIPFDNVDAELVREPLKWSPGDIGRFMVFFGTISSVFDLVTFAVLWWVHESASGMSCEQPIPAGSRSRASRSTRTPAWPSRRRPRQCSRLHLPGQCFRRPVRERWTPTLPPLH